MIPGKRSTVSGIVRPNLGRSILPPAPPVALGCRHRCIVEDWKNVEAEMGCKARKARNAVMEPSGSWFLFGTLSLVWNPKHYSVLEKSMKLVFISKDHDSSQSAGIIFMNVCFFGWPAWKKKTAAAGH